MKTILFSTLSLSLALGNLACAQDAAPPVTTVAVPLKVESEVVTGDFMRFVRPADLKAGKPVALVLKNLGDAPVRAQLSMGVKERSNAVVPLAAVGEVTIPAKGQVSTPLSAAQIGPRQGIKYVDWKLTAGANSASGHSSFSVLDPVGITPGVQRGEFIFGNQGIRGYWDYELKDQIMRAAMMIGTESMRGTSDWRKLEPQPGQYNWKGEDEMVALAEKYGAEVQYLIAYGGAPWTKSAETRARIVADGIDPDKDWPQGQYPPTVEAWRSWNRALAQHYKGRVHFYEVWNEPDLEFFRGTAPQYFELLKGSYEEIKAVDPTASVMTGGFASVEHPHHHAAVLDITLTQGKPYFDLLAYHRHGTFAGLQDEVDNKLLPMMKRAGVTQPLYFNETAMGREYAREYDQAVELPKRLAWAWSRGAKGYHYFTTWNQRSEGVSAQGYEMVNWDFSPRPAWVAYNEMSRVLRGRKFSHHLDLGKGRWGFAFSGKGDFSGQSADDYAVVAWTEDNVLPDAPIVLNVGAGASARVVDLMGNSVPAPVSEGRVVLPVAHDPQYLVISNAKTKPMPQGALLTAARAGAVVPGRTQTLSVTLANPYPQARKARLTWQVPAPLQARGPVTSEVTIAANATANSTLQVALPDGAKPAADGAPVVVNYSIEKTTLATQTAIPVAFGYRIPRGEMTARAADFDLRNADNIVNNMDIDPATQDLSWKGPGDLSARAWLSRGENALQMRFEVRDDAHQQPYRGNDLWKGDSVQLALAVPGQDGYFEIGLERTNDGGSAVHSWNTPKGYLGGEVYRAIKLQTSREGDRTIYNATLPYQAFGLSDELLRQGVRFSFVVNDLDDPKREMREGYLRLSDGIAGSKDISRFPTVVLD